MRAVAAPPGAEPGRYFLCDRCNFTLKDRRRRGYHGHQSGAE